MERVHAQTHIYRHEPVFAGERLVLSELTHHGMKVLDVGCAATGRSARLLAEFGCEVYSIDVNVGALAECAARTDTDGISIVAADMQAMPFSDGFFDLVLIAFHGIDYLHPDSQRIQALREICRVMTRKGSLVFNSFNPVGLVFSPSALRTRRALAWKARHVLKLAFLKRTFIDPNCLELSQRLPIDVIAQVRAITDLEFIFAISRNGRSKNLLWLTLFSSGPYYVFCRNGNSDGAQLP